MGIVLWTVLFLVYTGVCAWIVLGDGVETVAELVAAAFLGAEVHRWSEQGIRVFVGLTWVLEVVWFVLGLFEPSWRLW